ncbi:MAG: glycosyltransferase family 1 protein [Halioglobus sp.]
MNIGIDATCWWNNRGFGRFTREILTALFELDSGHRFYLFVDQPLHDLQRFSSVTVVQVPSSRPTTEAAVADSSRSPFDMFRLYRAVSRCSLDIMFFPAVYSWFPVPRQLPTMITVFDAIAEHYPKLIFPGWRSRLFWTIKMKCAIWSSQRILTVSQAAKQEIVEYIGADPDVIDVTSAAPNPLFRHTHDAIRIAAARQRAGLPGDVPLIIFVGGLAPHKNLHGLLDGFELALGKGRLRNVHLALIGDFKGAGFFSNYDSLHDRVRANAELCDRVHFSGYVSDDDLVALYSSALAVAMPSYSEGFGLPAIEAMACAAPVLASDRGSLPEVVGDGGLYFDPFDVEAIAAAIIDMVENDDLRAQLASNALSRASTFTWRRAAQLTLAHLEAMHRG